MVGALLHMLGMLFVSWINDFLFFLSIVKWYLSPCIFFYGNCSEKLLERRKDGAQLPLVNKTMMYISSKHASSASSSGVVPVQLIAGAASIIVAVLLFWPIL